MKDLRSRNGSNLIGTRRRALQPINRRRINLSLTPLAHWILEESALKAGATKSQVIEDWILAEASINGSLSPLGLDSKRRGHKSMRGQAINHCEVKQQLTISLSSPAIKYLGTMSKRADCSRSEVVERMLRGLYPPLSLFTEEQILNMLTGS